MERVFLVSGELGDVVLATSPKVAGGEAFIVGLFGVDGVDVGADDAGGLIVYPLEMDEGAPGVYSVQLVVEQSGVYFAVFEVDGVRYGPVVVRVLESDSKLYVDAETDVSFTLAVVTSFGESSVQITITDREGTVVGANGQGDQYVWPQAVAAVPGRDGCWYFDDLVFDAGGKMHVALRGSSGPVWNSILVVHEQPQGSASSFDGWIPDSAYDPANWLSIAEIRRMTGWASSVVSDAKVRELRRMAIETFIERTNRWFPAWTGTWHGLRGQGTRLYLPVPVLTTQDGAEADPVVTYVDKFGSYSDVREIDDGHLCWRVRGQYASQPYAEIRTGSWDSAYGVKIKGTFGTVGISSKVPLGVRQCIIGLIRWHSLSYGVGPDEARDQATLNRTMSENARERSVQYHEAATSSGLTGDPVVDRLLAQYTVNPQPWAMCGGDL